MDCGIGGTTLLDMINMTKITHSIAIDVVQIIMSIIDQADEGEVGSRLPATQINLGPKVVAELRDVVQRIKAIN